MALTVTIGRYDTFKDVLTPWLLFDVFISCVLILFSFMIIENTAFRTAFYLQVRVLG